MFFDNELPSNEAIIQIVENARLDAIQDLKEFYLDLTNDELDLRCQLTSKNDIDDLDASLDDINSEIDFNEIDHDEEECAQQMNMDLNIDFNYDIPEELDLPDLTSLSNISGDLQLHSFDKSEDDITEDSIFTCVTNRSGTKQSC